MKNLQAIVSGLDCATVGQLDKQIASVEYDSRNARPGSLFCCLRGVNTDGHEYAEAAIASGATAILVDHRLDLDGVTQVICENTRWAMGKVAASFYDHPCDSLKVIAVTGTNGKTSTTYCLEGIFRETSQLAGVIGTIEIRIGQQVIKAVRTTPESPDLQRILAQMVSDGVEMAAMEVSSHAIELDRHRGCRFDAAIFTNLSQDHLDFHGSMEDYFSSKSKLFTDGDVQKESFISAIGTSDDWSDRLADVAQGKVVRFGTRSGADVLATELAPQPSSSSFELEYRGEKVGTAEDRWVVPLGGTIGTTNALGAIAVSHELGIEFDDIKVGLAGITAVPGRMQPVDAGQPFAVIVDYAHTPEALEAVLRDSQKLTEGRVICVFGCGGDRDRDKRPKMGNAVDRYSDLSVVTSDNPRGEDPLLIINDIMVGMGREHVVIEPDRRRAITLALTEAVSGDLVLIAGKGHEVGQTIAGNTIPFDDTLVAVEALGGLGWS